MVGTSTGGSIYDFSNTVAPYVGFRLSCPNCKIQNVGFGLFSHSRNTWNIHKQCGALRVPENCAVSVTSGGTGAEHRPEILEANGVNSRIQGARTRTQPSKFDVASVLICQSQRTNLRLWLRHLGNELHVLQLRHLCDGLEQQCLGLLNEHLEALVRRSRQTHDDGSVFHIGHLYFVKPFPHQHPHFHLRSSGGLPHYLDPMSLANGSVMSHLILHDLLHHVLHSNALSRPRVP